MNIEDMDPQITEFKVGDWILHRDIGVSLVTHVLPLKKWEPRIEIFIFQWNKAMWFCPEQMIHEFIPTSPSWDNFDDLFTAKFHQYTEEEINARNKKCPEENKSCKN